MTFAKRFRALITDCLFRPPSFSRSPGWGCTAMKHRKPTPAPRTSQMESWGLQPYGITKDADDLAREFSRLLRQRRLLPTDQQNDGRILAETAINEIQAL